MLRILQLLWSGLNKLGLFTFFYQVGSQVTSMSGTDDEAINTEDNSLSNTQVAKIGGYVLSAMLSVVLLGKLYNFVKTKM